MLNPVLFVGGLLVAGQYLLGCHRWNREVTLGRAILVCQRPSAGILTLGLEVGGVLTEDVFTVDAGSGEFVDILAMDRAVPPEAPVRWKVTSFSGADEESATSAAITLLAL